MSANNGTAIEEAIRNDGTLLNALTGLGTEDDKSEYTVPGFGTFLTKNDQETLVKNAIVSRIVRAHADAAISRGWEITLGAKSNPKLIAEINNYQKLLKIAKSFNRAERLARTYGGAAIVIFADDGRSPDQPIDRKHLKKIVKLKVLDRYKIRPHFLNLEDPEEAEYYELVFSPGLVEEFKNIYKDKFQGNYLIHRDRVIRFDGAWVPPDVMLSNDGWGISIIEQVWEDFKQYCESLKSSVTMLADASFYIHAMEGLLDLVRANEEELLRNRFRAIRKMISTFKGLVIDKNKESVEFANRQLAGVDAIIAKAREAFIGATGIPHDRLFGESPSGLGATGESEEKNWAKEVEGFQMSQWYDKLRDLLQLIFLSADGPSSASEPDDWDIEFRSIIQQSNAEIIDSRSSQSQVDNVYISNGVLLPEEVRKSRFGGAKYSIETVLDEKAWARSQQQPGFEEAPQEPEFDLDLQQDSLDFIPGLAVRKASRLGLSLLDKHPLGKKESSKPDIKLGIQIGLKLTRGDRISPDEIAQMLSFFNRHKAYHSKRQQEPEGKESILWLLWGGDAGKQFAIRANRQMQITVSKRTDSISLPANFICRDRELYRLAKQRGGAKRAIDSYKSLYLDSYGTLVGAFVTNF
jgi:phage-related protein (TIGR01555 family)